MYLESLLRDRPFTIRTDHRNLLSIKQSSNRMIVRWYMALSEFTFNREFISGEDNGIADSMSRLCRNNVALYHNSTYILMTSSTLSRICTPIQTCVLHVH